MVIFGDDQHVCGRLGVDVAKRDRAGTLGDHIGRGVTGGDLAEKAIRHPAILASAAAEPPTTYRVASLRIFGPPPLRYMASRIAVTAGVPAAGRPNRTRRMAGTDWCWG